jgi:hypothetical protein
MKAWGCILVITGIARFLLGFIIFNILFLIFKSVNIGALLIATFSSIISYILIFTLAGIMIYTYLSIRQTTIKDGKLIYSRILSSGIALTILYFLTFIVEIPGSVYWEEIVGIFITYFILKRSYTSDFNDLRNAGVILFVISIIEFLGRVILILYFFYDPLFTPMWISFYLIIGLLFMIPYVYSGFRLFTKSSQILEEQGG